MKRLSLLAGFPLWAQESVPFEPKYEDGPMLWWQAVLILAVGGFLLLSLLKGGWIVYKRIRRERT